MTVLLEPLPPRTMPETGRRDVLLEAAVTVRAPAAVSVSPTENVIGVDELLDVMETAAIELIVGAAFDADGVVAEAVGE